MLDEVRRYAAPVHQLYGETASGRPVMDMRYVELDRRLHGLGVQRAALFSVLDAAWTQGRQLHCGMRVVDIDPERGVLRDEQGRRYEGFDLIVLADGAASGLRSQVAAPRIDRPYPWGAQWCLVPSQDWPWADVLQQRYVGARRMVGTLPVGTRPGDEVPRLSFFWSLPASELEHVCAGDAAWCNEVEAVWPRALEQLAPMGSSLQLANARYRDTTHARWFRGRAVLLGDAAHAMSPQLGQGVNMALLDASALRQALRSSATREEALIQYTRVRQAHVWIYHFWSRWLTPLFQSEHDRLARMRDRVFHPLSRMPGARGQMLRILSGTRRGWLGRFPLPKAFLQGLEAAGQTAPLPVPSANGPLRQA